MKEQPVLTTERLILRPYSLSDAKDLQRLIGDREVSDTLLLVPYPYLDGMAEEWIDKQSLEYQEGNPSNLLLPTETRGSSWGRLA
jgi:RimJ/RimL family protein N-acetyltransferase